MGTKHTAASRPDHSGYGLENVTQQSLGIDDDVLQRAAFMTNLGVLAYLPAEEAAQQLKDDMPGWQMESISVNKQKAAIFYNDDEIIVAFEGSGMLEPRHWLRNLVQSPVSNKDHIYKNDIKDRSALEHLPSLDKLTAELAVQQGRPDAAETIKQHILHAKVHGGWSGVLDHTVESTYPPNIIPENSSFWNAIQHRIDSIIEEKPTRKLSFTGHSSGGAYASIAAARWMLSRNIPVESIYSFGQPRAGGPHFREALHALLGEDPPPYYRFEMLGDPIPSLPPLRPEHFVHGGQWICLTHTGALVGATNAQGEVVTAAQSAQATGAPMSSQNYLTSQERLDQFVRVSRNQMDEIVARWGGKHVDVDSVFSSVFKTILDLPAHFKGHSSRVHALTTMQDAIHAQLRKSDLARDHRELLGTIPLGEVLLKLVSEIHQHVENKVIVLDEEAASTLRAVDEQAQLWASNLTTDSAGKSIILKEVAHTLIREDASEKGGLFKLISALGASTPLSIQEQLLLLRDAFSDYVDRNTSIMPEKGIAV